MTETRQRYWAYLFIAAIGTIGYLSLGTPKSSVEPMGEPLCAEAQEIKATGGRDISDADLLKMGFCDPNLMQDNLDIMRYGKVIERR